MTSAIQIPHNIELEQGLLGALLLDNRARERVETLSATHFYDPQHGEIFDLICATIEAGRVASIVTLKTAVASWPPISKELSVAQYMGRLAANGASIFEVADYAKKIKELATRRAMIDIGYALVSGASNEDDPAIAVLNRAEIDLFALADKGRASREISFSDALSAALALANAAYENGGKLSGLSTGLADLDSKLGGLQKSDLLVLAGRPAIGKTALVTNIAFSVARSYVGRDGKANGCVHFFSQEMSATQLAMRLLGEHSEVSSEKLRRGTFAEHEFRSAMETADRIRSTPIHIDETGGISLAQLVTKARRVKRQKNTHLMVIDYLQLMSGSGRSNENRVNEITAITTGLKALAKELDIPIIALSQLSRKVEERSDKRPQLADLRESGSIEQDADVVLFVYRDEYYLDREEPSTDDTFSEEYLKWKERKDKASGKAEVIIAKHRHGPTGIVELSFEADKTRFGNIARHGGRA